MRKIILLFICSIAFVALQAEKKDKTALNIVYIGNSITQGVLLESPEQDAPPVKATEWLRSQPDMGNIDLSNQGVSGLTTVDFLPASETFFPEVKKAADLFYHNSSTQLLFSIMLGTNDSAIKGTNGAPVQPKQYHTNMKAIIDELLALYPQCKVIVHRPIWYSPNTYNNSMYLKEGLQRLESYLPELQTMVGKYAQTHPGQVFMGDTEAFDHFRNSYQTELVPENGNAGTFYLHPNQKGAAQLGEFWGKAIYKVIK